MSKKSILYSILAILSGGGMIFADILLFGIETILGIIGIVLTLILPGIFMRKAISHAEGIFDRLLAKLITPVLIIIFGGLALLAVFFWMK